MFHTLRCLKVFVKTGVAKSFMAIFHSIALLDRFMVGFAVSLAVFYGWCNDLLFITT